LSSKVERAQAEVERLQASLEDLQKNQEEHAAVLEQLPRVQQQFRQLAQDLQEKDQALAVRVLAIANLQQPEFAKEDMTLLFRILKSLKKGNAFDVQNAEFLRLRQKKEELRKIVAEKEELLRQQADRLAHERHDLRSAQRNEQALTVVADALPNDQT